MKNSNNKYMTQEYTEALGTKLIKLIIIIAVQKLFNADDFYLDSSLIDERRKKNWFLDCNSPLAETYT